MLGAWVLAWMDPHPFKLILALLIFLFLWATYTSGSHRVYGQFSYAAMLMFGAASGTLVRQRYVAVLIIYFRHRPARPIWCRS